MKAVVKMNKWANARTNVFVDTIRILLGAFLFWKGMQFAGQTEELVQFIQPNDPMAATLILAHYIAMAHLAGGVLVAFGLITRLAILAQIPILIGAIVLNAAHGNGMMLLESSVVFAAATYFLIAGPGKHSVDYNLKMHM